MKNIKLTLGFMAASLVMASCDDLKFGNNFLEKPISTEMNIDSVFAHKIYAEQALAQVYHSLPDFQPLAGRLHWGIMESITDLGDYVKWTSCSYHRGDLTSSSTGGGVYSLSYNTEHGEFSSIYGIRKAYIFIENIDRVPDMTQEEKNRRKAEAQMIIAYHYVDWFRHYGGMPWIDHAYTPEESFTMERMTLDQMIQKICGLIDEAAPNLPWDVEPDDDGRMHRAGALALKARLLLFAASPLFNSAEPYMTGETADKKITWFGEYSEKRWEDAVEACLAFLRENARNGNTYKLVDTGNPREDYKNGYFTRYNHEVLISSHRWTRWDVSSKCFFQMKYGVCVPTLNFVDMFEMRDGTKFDWNKEEHKNNPFFDENGEMVRDPRLYETFIVNEDKFRGRKAEICSEGRERPKVFGSGASNRWSNMMSYYGIAMRKHYQDHDTEVNQQFYQCPLMRLPEIYLSLAEAMNELGKANQQDEFGYTAYDYVNMVRGRVDMKGITETDVPAGETLREYILTERAREFGYEEIRYFDINRWKHKDYLDVPLRQLLTYGPVGGPYTYEIKEGVYEIKRNWVERWSNKYYLLPIPQTEINKKYGMIQNPGW